MTTVYADEIAVTSTRIVEVKYLKTYLGKDFEIMDLPIWEYSNILRNLRRHIKETDCHFPIKIYNRFASRNRKIRHKTCLL